MINVDYLLHPLKYNLSFDLGWPWSSSNRFPLHCLFHLPSSQHWTPVLLSSVCRMCIEHFWKVMLLFRTWNSTETDFTLTDQCRVSAGDSCLSLLLSNPPQTRAWSYFSSTSLLGSGHEPPLEFKEEKCTCWFARDIIAQKHSYQCFLMHFPSVLNISVFQPLLCFYTSLETFNKHTIILCTSIYALPGHICIYYFAKL